MVSSFSFIQFMLDHIRWIWSSITFQVFWYENYFWGLVVISLFVWGLELCFPWRKDQSIFREDFFLDLFYMFFNFFGFTIITTAFYKMLSLFFKQVGLGVKSLVIFDIAFLDNSLQLLIFFILLDFLQWFTHRLLHKYAFLWRFHQLHHSVKQMGFAAHLRYHWIENILYKPSKVLVVMFLGGFEPEQTYIIHFFAIFIGHLNHSNIYFTWGLLKYIFNNPVMHLYHHAYKFPKDKFSYGVNFGISLSIWDYLFKTAYIPKYVNANEKLGFFGDTKFPSNFIRQFWFPFIKQRKSN